MKHKATVLKKKSIPSISMKKLLHENSDLRERLGEAEETLRAIHEGEVDAVIVSGAKGDRVFSLVETENLYRLMVETMNEAGVAVSPDGTLVFCNDRAAALLQHSKEQLLGHPLYEFVADGDRKRFNRLLQTALTQTANEQFSFLLKNGSTLPMHLWASHLDRPDGPMICLIGTDLSKLEAQKELIALLQKQHEELRESRIAALNLMEDAIEAKKKTEEAGKALVAAQRQTQNIIDNTTAIVYAFDLEERFVMANATVAKLLNSTPAQMIGKRRHDFMPQADADWHEANDRKVIEAGRVLDFEEKNELQGRSITWLTTKFPLRDSGGKIYAVGGFSTDITERKRAEEALLESEQKYRRLFEAAKDGILILDFDTGLIVDANPFLLDWLGYSHGDMLQKHLWDVGVFKDIAASKEAYAELQLKEVIHYEDLPLEAKDGTSRIVEFVSNVYLVDGKKVIQCNIRDITERRKAEEERERILNELKVREEALSLANKELEAFSYSVSHDLRNPLNAIMTNIEVLSMEVGAKADSDAATAMAHISESTHRMANVITDLLTLSGISRRDIKRKQVDLSAMVQKFLEELKTSEPHREAEFKVQGGLMVDADPGLLKLLVENLARNAWKFSSKRKGTQIEFGVFEKDGKHTYFMRDNGVGFDMKDADQLFKPYKRLHSTQEYKGTGIGLAIAKRVVEKHGGAIWAEGEKDKGATFYFQIP